MRNHPLDTQKTLNSEGYTRSIHCTSVLSLPSQKSQMTLKIEKDSDGPKTIVRLSGRLQSEHLDEFKTEIERDHPPVALDLDGVMLVDVEVVRFLNTCEENNVELLHCSPFIREWMLREQDRKE